jgi:NAD(P)-dependent dehydrogenase (short-subunit alcohol dehydrogenase family)
MDIRGTAALVTGGASGLGEATARMLSAAGATVTIVDRDEDRGSALAKELGNAQFAAADVTDEADVQAAVEHAAGTGSPLRIAVNCAGIAWLGRTLNKDNSAHALADFVRVITINLVGTFNVLRLAAGAIAETEPGEDDERGLIVNTASIAAFEGQIGQVAYAASKGGVVGLTLPAARDLSVLGIRVCTIAPGTFETPMLMTLPEAARASLGQSVPFPKRLGRPEEYAKTVRFLAENGMMNGEVIRVDGAIRMAPK